MHIADGQWTILCLKEEPIVFSRDYILSLSQLVKLGLEVKQGWPWLINGWETTMNCRLGKVTENVVVVKERLGKSLLICCQEDRRDVSTK